MPWIHLKLTNEVFTSTQEVNVVDNLIAAKVRIDDESMSPFTWIPIEKICNGEWSIGG